VSGGDQGGEQVLPVVPGGFHGDQHFTWGAEQRKDFLIAGCILRKGRGLALDFTVSIDDGDDVRFRRDIDPGISHTASRRRRKSGASEPVLLSTLVYARTRQRRPRDTVRTLSTGRGRQSHSRGLPLERAAATLSR